MFLILERQNKVYDLSVLSSNYGPVQVSLQYQTTVCHLRKTVVPIQQLDTFPC